MSKTTIALEAAVADVIANRPAPGATPTTRQRILADRAFAAVLKIIAPRIRHFIRQYGLTAHWDDAEQCCAIGVHRAIEAYDPTRAQFTTFVNWQLRGELQSLRFRLMTDQRQSARRVEATTVSLHAATIGPDGEPTSLEAMIEDEAALDRTEAGVDGMMADDLRTALLDAYVAQLRQVGVDQLKRKARSVRSVQSETTSLPRFRAKPVTPDASDLAELESRIATQRALVERRLRDDPMPAEDVDTCPIERERARQVAKRAARVVAEIATSDPRFAGFADRRKPHPRRRKTDHGAADTTILPDTHAPHNALARVIVLDPAAVEAIDGTDAIDRTLDGLRGEPLRYGFGAISSDRLQ
ncbi:sigma-70 family RNA polymerase sigma factor [Sphingomonas sp. TREG-RG-20F-R18-01]|uniref:sigma-70 family RNA polymerase sigma factor n=1 Tax=Sphingomonas sp. TREG-RG-20F-R18-01 TaxID=2914982 RepID=UPI001F59B5A6|nr:sigma-70 family RNA polymerase sigma factor [Sphingomonas sp. TREG-RG-20F-R18-01]